MKILENYYAQKKRAARAALFFMLCFCLLFPVCHNGQQAQNLNI